MSGAYTPPAGYAPGPNPLAALYGAGKARGEEAFKGLKHHPARAPLPSGWVRALSKLTASAGVGGARAKLTAWGATERARLDQRELDREVTLTLHIFGDRAANRRALESTLSEMSELKGLTPQRWGDTLDHSGEAPGRSLKVSREVRWREGEREHAVLTLEWRRGSPAPTPGVSLRNCRYLPALPAPTHEGAPPAWLSKQFSSTSERRFAEWSYQVGSPQEATWRALFVYKSGLVRDEGVGRLSDVLSANGGVRESMEGMEQRWRLSRGGVAYAEAQWWSETAPGEMGCVLDAPLLGVAWRDL